MAWFGYVFFQLFVAAVVIRQLVRTIDRGPGFFKPDVEGILRGLALLTGVSGLVLASLAAQPVLFPTLDQRLAFRSSFAEATIQSKDVDGDPNRIEVKFTTPTGPVSTMVDAKDSILDVTRADSIYVRYDPRHPVDAKPADVSSSAFVQVHDVPLLTALGSLDLIASACLIVLWLRRKSHPSGAKPRWWWYSPQPEQQNRWRS